MIFLGTFLFLFVFSFAYSMLALIVQLPITLAIVRFSKIEKEDGVPTQELKPQHYFLGALINLPLWGLQALIVGTSLSMTLQQNPGRFSLLYYFFGLGAAMPLHAGKDPNEANNPMVAIILTTNLILFVIALNGYVEMPTIIKTIAQMLSIGPRS